MPANAILQIDDEGMKVQAFAPNRIITLAAGEPVNMNEILAVGSPYIYTYYINGDTDNLMTRSGIIVRGAEVKTLTFTKDITLEVM